jgi:RNA polymerase sigma-70 factor (ECF subfamily)
MGSVHDAVERAARESYGRLLAFLSARSRDIAAAEDALIDAFEAALSRWPESGIPERPEAWLLVAARRRLIDAARRQQTHRQSLPALIAAAAEAEELSSGPGGLGDERLKLLFISAHPQIDPSIRTPLMLQTILRLDAARIASAFCVSPDAMARRLSRAKSVIRNAGIPFEVPEAGELKPRLGAVLEAIYAAYGSGWDDVAGDDPRRSGLAGEAIHLAQMVTTLLPEEAEPHGLLALMLHCEARHAARRDARGAYVPLGEQDCTLWSYPMIDMAERELARAAAIGNVGRFQLEAAIQSAHANRAVSGRTDWHAVGLLYEGLVRLAPTTGALVGRAAAIAELKGPQPGLALLKDVPEAATRIYQPYWALTGHLLAALGRTADAREAYDRAIGLCDDPAMRAFLNGKVAKLR